MNPTSADARRARVASEAAAWAQRLNSPHPSQLELGEFVDWLRESPVHVAEMLRIERLTAAGAPVLSPAHDFLDGRLRAGWVADPGGNPIQIVQRKR